MASLRRDGGSFSGGALVIGLGLEGGSGLIGTSVWAEGWG